MIKRAEPLLQRDEIDIEWNMHTDIASKSVGVRGV